MALERLLELSPAPPEPHALYEHLEFPAAPAHRPYVYVNMVATACGKSLQAPVGSSAKGLGSPTDQMLMRRLQDRADCAISGAGTVRIGNVAYPPRMWRAVVTRTGNLPEDRRYFTDAPDKVIIFAPRSLPSDAKERLGSRWKVHLTGEQDVDPIELLSVLRGDYGVERVVLEGGADLNYAFFAAGVVDELFLSVAPKVKGGAGLPTVVDGPGLPGQEVVQMDLLSVYRDSSELYLRYRVQRSEDWT